MPIILCLFLLLPVFSQSLRIENEYKLSFPCDKKEVLWSYLQKKYQQTPDLAVQFSVEDFKDVYFDTTNLELLHMNGAVRRRYRLFPNNPNHPKHLRSLIQIKLKRPGEAQTNRSEIKFAVKKKYKNYSDDLPPHFLVRNESAFLDEIKKLSLSSTQLSQAFVIHQVRSRVYISKSTIPYATITVDEVTSSKWLSSVKFCETEIELNEKGFTAANENERNEMQRVNDIFKKDLEEKFDFLVIDQTPKYNKTYNAFEKNIPFFKELLQINIWMNRLL